MNSPNKQSSRTRFLADLPPLVNGDHMSQAEFHRRYEAYPEDVKFELIGGIVFEVSPFRKGREFMSSPLRRTHGKNHATLSSALWLFASQTPGVEMLDNATVILADDSEPQPDLSLRILREFGGQSRENAKDYIEGPPELVAEIALSSRAIDLNRKRQDYERASVKEYMVLSLEEHELVWFDFAANDLIVPDRRGVARSRAFPGLWVNVPALLENQAKGLIATLNRGLKSAAYTAFVKKLEAARKRSTE
jgi:Uma2 family endonuclease